MKSILISPILFSFLFSSCDSQSESTPIVQEESTEIKQETKQVKVKPKKVKLDTAEISEIEIDLDSNTEMIEVLETENDLNTSDTAQKLPSEIEEIDSTERVTKTIVEEPHAAWDKLTRKHINTEGKVNYAGFLSDKKDLEQYLRELQELHKEIVDWNKKKQLAYWINLYNAVTVKLIVDNYPVSSITDLEGGKPWDTQLVELSGTAYTLNAIENKIIRPLFNEPRIHFAVNCAAKSCPKILNKAWTEHNLERSLTAQTEAFLSNKEQNSLDENEIIISKIFEWYKVDFGSTNENIIQFINRYSEIAVSKTASVNYNEYDWTLNSK